MIYTKFDTELKRIRSGRGVAEATSFARASVLTSAVTLGIANKFMEPVAGAVLGKIAILVLIIFFIQKRPRGLFALKVRAVEA